MKRMTNQEPEWYGQMHSPPNAFSQGSMSLDSGAERSCQLERCDSSTCSAMTPWCLTLWPRQRGNRATDTWAPHVNEPNRRSRSRWNKMNVSPQFCSESVNIWIWICCLGIRVLGSWWKEIHQPNASRKSFTIFKSIVECSPHRSLVNHDSQVLMSTFLCTLCKKHSQHRFHHVSSPTKSQVR